MRKFSTWDWIITGAIALTAVLIGVLWWNVSSLYGEADKQRALAAEFKSQVEEQEKQLKILRTEAARLQTNFAFMRTAVTDNQSVIESLLASRKLCDIVSSTLSSVGRLATQPQAQEEIEALGNPIRTTCFSHALNLTPEFLKKYNLAVDARFEGRDYGKVAALYSEALALASNEQYVHSWWRARALEGHAYALMRLKKFDQARAELNEANELAAANKDYPIFVFARLTSIKLMCMTNSPPETIQAELAKLRADLDIRATRLTPASEDYPFAKRNRCYVEADGELFNLCNAVNIRPMESICHE